ncbi:filamentous hemagglutinin N-terminal domain-containing protein [Propionivibrio sp.]|uniref:two-partner secretion domain-containing protein n=1 Tax=Propionivibrio sp. TaxID=2212460 RepID=UPI0025F86457|nr:filamentous hemagglutinin N-terminal domain-containing protein [Propionivibrio sp.]MBK7355128.1 filamentous hemagglutinin N-terminal domain-containing protein [Propionivibrio sp.]
MNAHRPAAFAVFAAFATLAALMPLASAQIVAYKAAPASQQPTVLTAGNGVPLINIQTPSAAGVSRNTYSQFDVDPNGVILNNARNNALTQLGGWVQGNPWLAHGSARVILNEVVAANPSQLLGYVEIAGSAAQVVIANPAGLTCNGCGFINASRATLTTGTPLVNGGNLESYRVEGGTLRIEGTGLDASRVGYTDLIARAVEVNAGLWAQTLKVTTGSNVVDAGNTQATPISGSGPAPAFAIDVASLGGLYAGKITLVGTEAGVGVRNAGTLGASVGEVTVTVDGRLQNSGSLMARGDIALNTPGELHNTGLVSAGGTLAITADRVINADTLGASQGLEGQALTINADTVDNHSGALRADTALSISSSGSLDNRAGLIASAQTLSILDPKASKTLAIANTAGTLIAGQRLDIDSASLSGDGKLLSQGDLAIKLVADFTHAGGFAELTANGRATLETAGTLTNQATMQGGTALTLRAASIDNQAAGEILAPELALTASETHSLTNRGLIDGGDTRIDAVTLNNLGTGRLYGDHLSIAATTLNNEAEGAAAPVIVARDRLDLAVGTLNNRDEAVLFSAGDLAIGGSLDSARRATGRAGDINNVSATLEALGELSIQAATVNNKRRSLAIERELKDSASRSYTRCEDPPDCDYIDYLTETTTHAQDEVTSTSPAASILASKALRIAADTLTNEYASIQAGGDLTLTGSSLANTGAELFLQTDVATSGYWRHWGRDPHPLPTTYSSTAVKTGSVDAVISAGGDLTGSFTDRIDSLTIRQHAAPVLAGSGTGTRSGASIAPVGDTLPASSLFRPNPNPDGRYLIETDPRFTSYRQWLGSDYLLAQLQLDPAITQKRLGDGFYEQRLIDEQVGQLTGRRFLVGYQNEEDQYRALMDAGVTVARQWKLIPGVALSAAQMAALTTDIVWLVEKVVAGQKVLVPQVYARVQPGDLAPSGAVLGGNNVRLDVAGELATSGTVAGRQLVTLDAERLQNLRGHIQGADVEVRAQTDLLSRGGTFTARDRLAVSAGRDLSLESSTVDQHYRQAGRVAGAVDKTVVDRVAGLYVAGDAGVLLASAGRDLKLLGAAVANTGSAGSTLLAAGHDLTLGTVSESSQAATTAKKGYWRENRRTEVGSTLQTSGDLTLVAGNDLTARAANVSSDQGALLASAGNDLKIDAGQARTATETYAKSSKRGLLGSSSTVRRDTVEDGTALASTFSGDSTTLIADRDLSIKGSNVVATKDTTLSAGRDLALEAATQTHNETHYSKTKQSGVFGSGGIGFTIGSRQNSTDQKTDATLAAQSTVGSTAGNVLLLAGENYRQVGSDVIAVQGDINVAAKRVDIVEARQTRRTVTETKSKQSGLTLAVSSPVISAIQTVQQMSQAAAQTKDPRMQWLAAANIAMTGKNTVDAVVAGQGTTVELPDGTVKDNQMPVLDESGKTIGSRDPNAADQVGGINVSLSIGSSKSRSKSTQTSDTGRGFEPHRRARHQHHGERRGGTERPDDSGQQSDRRQKPHPDRRR